MICQLEGLTGSSYNGKPMMRAGEKSPERSGYELLAWAILEQAVDDLVSYARYGIIAPDGTCRRWPFELRRRIKKTPSGYQYANHRQRATIAASTGPYEHKQLRAWFLSTEAETFCEMIGCNLPPDEIFYSTVKNHSGGKK
jgi:hypothetical protein